MDWLLSTPFWMIAVALCLVVILVLIIRKASQSGARRAGKEGEQACLHMLQNVAREDDHIFTNVELKHDGQRTELDCLVVNSYGIFIIEAKNYSGRLVGGEEDFEWEKYHTTRAGNTYRKKVKNPIKQVGRQTYILSHILRDEGIHDWIQGYVFLAQGSSPVRNDMILHSERDAARVIHPRTARVLSDQKIHQICKMFASHEK